MNQFPYLYPHSLSEAERLNEEELWQDNRDAEVSHTQLTEMFRHSDPAALMDEAEQAQLAELDDTVTVYRGVTTINSDNLLALSWTLDYETADWFARRFDEDGTVYKAQIDKEHIFALFNGRDEGWSDCEAVHKTLDELNDPGEIGIEFTYIFTFEGRWIYFPTGEAELGFRDVKEDLDNDTVQYGSFFTEHENNMDWPDNGDFALDTDLRL